MKKCSLTLLAVALVVTMPMVAQAYSLALPGRYGCHEEITSAALRVARAQFPASAPPIAPDRNNQALIDDIAWLMDADMRDFGAASLLLGVRDNDLQGHSITDSFELVQINADPTLQKQHCLRSPSEDEPNGTAEAIEDCHQFVLTTVGEALDALDQNGVVDASMQLHLPVDLALRGSTTDAILPQFYVRMGQALHTIEDGFAHNFRTSDGMQITSALNWVEDVTGTLVESRDGPPHSFELDDCTATDPLRVQRHHLAITAASDVMSAVLNPALTRAQKLGAVDTVFATYFAIAPNCDQSNQYCDPAENKLRDTFVCNMGAGTGHPGELAILFGALFAMRIFLRRRKRRLRVPAHAFVRALVPVPVPVPVPIPVLARVPILVPVLALTLVALPASRAFAQSEAGTPPPPPNAAEIQKIREAKTLGPRFGVYAAFGGSLDRPALAATLGARLRLSRRWTIGLDAEMNPWITTAGDVRLGAANIYFRGILNYPLNWSRVGLHSSVSLGTAIQLLDLYGAERGSVGIFVGVAPLGIDVAIARGLKFVFDPIGIYVPAPHLQGAPLWYLQYRVTVGIQWGG